MAKDNYLKNPLWVLAIGAATGLASWGLLAGLAQVIPMLGVMVSLAITGAAAGFTIAPTLGTVVAYSTVATGVVLSLQLVVRITREAKKEPLTWGAGILGLLSGFLVQMCEQFWFGPKNLWLFFSVIAALLVFVGGVFYSQRGFFAKIAGALTSVIAPAMYLGVVAYSQPQMFKNFMLAGDIRLWFPLVILLIIALILGILAHISARADT
jgi:hypothetical protein